MIKTNAVQARSIESAIKIILIHQIIQPGDRVLVLSSVQKDDIGKFERARIGEYVGIDSRQHLVEEARTRWQQKNKPFPAHFVSSDPFQSDLLPHIPPPPPPSSSSSSAPAAPQPPNLFNAIVSFDCMQRAFVDEENLRNLFSNVSKCLKPGGFFFGTCLDGSAIWYRAQKTNPANPYPEARGELYSAKFVDWLCLPFGTKCTTTISGEDVERPDSSEFLVHFPSMLKIAREHGLDWIDSTNLSEVYEEIKVPYKQHLLAFQLKDSPKPNQMEVLGLYSTFVFRKPLPLEPIADISSIPRAAASSASSSSSLASLASSSVPTIPSALPLPILSPLSSISSISSSSSLLPNFGSGLLPSFSSSSSSSALPSLPSLPSIPLTPLSSSRPLISSMSSSSSSMSAPLAPLPPPSSEKPLSGLPEDILALLNKK